jgi:hypothetical protein
MEMKAMQIFHIITGRHMLQRQRQRQRQQQKPLLAQHIRLTRDAGVKAGLDLVLDSAKINNPTAAYYENVRTRNPHTASE